MTGFGKAECELPNKKITIEIKSLNSKQLDIYSRLPSTYKAKDLEVRKLLSDRLLRGKIEFNMYNENLGEESNSAINQAIVKRYYEQMKSIYSELGLEITELTMQTILRLPDSVKTEHEELDEEEWALILQKIEEAIAAVDRFREQEGAALETDMLSQVASIIEWKNQVTPYENERIERVKTKLIEALKDIQNSVQNDQNRFEQELIFYLERLDINEEKVRLENHCQYFAETIKEPYPGKKIGFIAQEIGREINTMGSKANHTEIQKLVIQMKEALEKIKEQSLNIL